MNTPVELAHLFAESAIPADPEGMLAFQLEAAVRADDAQEAARLLAEGADPTRPAQENHFPAYFIAAQRSLDCLRLFAQNPTLDMKKPLYGRTLLQNALLGGKEDCARFLLPLSNPDHLEGEKWDALMCAAVGRLPAMVETLLAVNDPRRQDEEGQTALMLVFPAREHLLVDSRKGLRIIDLLLPSADLMAVDAYGNNLLHKSFFFEDEPFDIDSPDFAALRRIFPLMPAAAFLAENKAGKRPIDFPPLRALFEQRELDRQVEAGRHATNHANAGLHGGESVSARKSSSRL